MEPAARNPRTRLTAVYLLALGTAAVLVLALYGHAARALDERLGDPPIVRLAVGQVGLLERMSNAAIFLHTSGSEKAFPTLEARLKSSLEEWERVHAGLPSSDEPALLAAHAAADRSFQRLRAAARAMLSLYEAAPVKTEVDHERSSVHLSVLLEEEGPYVEAMGELTRLLGEDVRRDLARRRNVQRALLAGALLVLAATALFIHRPAVRTIDEQFRRLETSGRRFKALVENARDHVLELDREGRIVYAAPSFQELVAIGGGTCDGRGLDELVHEEDRPAVRQLLESLRAGESLPEATYRILDGWGRVHWLELASSSYAGDGGESMVLVARDVTLRRKSEKERELFQRQLEHTQKLESLGVLAGGIAHDFNNLLVGVLGNAELAAQSLPADSPALESVRAIEQAANRAAELTRALLAYAGSGNVATEPLELNRLVLEMTSLLEASISKRVALDLQLAPEGPPDTPWVSGDPTQLHQVVMNLILNAAESIEGDGEVRVTTGTTFVDRETLSRCHFRNGLATGRYAFLGVRDTGRGMEEERLARIFDPFFTTKFAGRGLGLAVVLGIVRGHGGTVLVRSEVGRGTEFEVLLPLIAGGPPASEETPTADAAEWRGRGTLLVVDDEESVRDVVARMLERLGYEVVRAGDGHAAVRLVRERPERFEAVLLDLVMPGMDGVETLGELHTLDPGLACVGMTGYGSDARRRFTEAGAAACLGKPFVLDELAAVLRGLDPAALGS